jgi:hypothetical protein
VVSDVSNEATLKTLPSYCPPLPPFTVSVALNACIKITAVVSFVKLFITVDFLQLVILYSDKHSNSSYFLWAFAHNCCIWFIKLEYIVIGLLRARILDVEEIAGCRFLPGPFRGYIRRPSGQPWTVTVDSCRGQCVELQLRACRLRWRCQAGVRWSPACKVISREVEHPPLEAVTQQHDWGQLNSVCSQTVDSWVESAVCSEAASVRTEAAEHRSWGAIARQRQWRLWRMVFVF